MISDDNAAHRRELGEFIRAQRERLTPNDVGLPAGTRRRTPGLRREEVAQLCGLSTTWYTWIEQGREVSVSPLALARLAAALRLARAERAYLFELAGKRDPAQSDDATTQASPAVHACLQAITCSAYILDPAWNALAWNPPAERLFTGWLDQPGDRNLLRFIFLTPSARRLIDGWEERAQRVVAEFRAFAGSSLDDPAIAPLIEELRQQSPDFARFWQQHHVQAREGGIRTFNHPADGFLRLEQVTFALVGAPRIKLTMLVPQRIGAAQNR